MQQTRTIVSRPGTLAEALQWQIEKPEEGRTALAGFLDEFYLDGDRENRLARLQTSPSLVDDSRVNALFGAIGEHLCRRWKLGIPPKWTEAEERFLHEPYFMGPERMKPFLIAESPSAFRRRFIFTEAEPLRRARMPRDGRWWYYEQIRTGLSPETSDDVFVDPCR